MLNNIGSSMILNSLTIDLESWVHRDYPAASSSKRKKLDKGSVLRATSILLDLFAQNEMETTFFVAGEIFDWYSWLIYEIKNKGHEIAFHTHSHAMLTSKDILMEELKKSKYFLEEFDPKGFRAPYMFMKKEYLLLLNDHGFTYDSSIYGNLIKPLEIEGMFEIPISTYPFSHTQPRIAFPRNLFSSLFAKEIPFGSGFFFGLLGTTTSWFIELMNRKGLPANIVVHPWQVDSRFRWLSLIYLHLYPYYLNRLKETETLLKRHSFFPMNKIMEEQERVSHD